MLIEGVSLATMSDRERTEYRALHMGFVFQFYNLMPVLTAVENVELPLLVARCRRRRTPAGARSRRSISSDSCDRAEHVPDELSGGERQRVHHRSRARERSSDRVGRRADGRPRQRAGRGDQRAHASSQHRTRVHISDRDARHLASDEVPTGSCACSTARSSTNN